MKLVTSFILSLLLAIAVALPGNAVVAKTRRISIRSSGAERSGDSYLWKRSVSQDGKILAFESLADLVPADDDADYDIYVRNLRTGRTRIASIKSNGTQVDGNNLGVEITADGRYVVFQADGEFTSHDDNGSMDVYRHDMKSGKTKLLSVKPNGDAGSGNSRRVSISPNGRFAAFDSVADDLVPNDSGETDVFVRDLLNGKTKRASVRSNGTAANNPSETPSVANDGTVAFTSTANNLVPNDENAVSDVFIHRFFSGKTRRVSISSGEEEGDGSSSEASISRDGDAVSFETNSSNFVTGAGDDQFDIFLRRISTGKTRLVSRRSNGDLAEGTSSVLQGALSYSGRYVAFSSMAENLVAGDSNELIDMFWHDMKTGKTKLVSVTHDDSELDSGAGEGSVSGDGRFVAFDSDATNLVPNDENGSYDVFRRGPLF